MKGTGLWHEVLAKIDHLVREHLKICLGPLCVPAGDVWGEVVLVWGQTQYE